MPFPQASIDWNRIFTTLAQLWDVLTKIDNLKLNKDFSNIEGDADLVVEHKVNPDGSWYRVYRSGWLEQGAIANGIPSSGVVKNLVKAYKDTNYTIITQCINKNVVTYNDGQVFCNNKTTTNFRLSAYASPNVNWYACGMGVVQHHEGTSPSDPGLEDLLG